MPMMRDVIQATEFRQRLAALCTRGGGAGLPRRKRDRHILFKSTTLLMKTKRSYTEPEINAVLDQWLLHVGQALALDRVSLRRDLVDAGYLVRDAAGRDYRVHEPTAGEIRFDADVEKVDPAAIVAAAREEVQARRRAHRPDRPGE